MNSSMEMKQIEWLFVDEKENPVSNFIPNIQSVLVVKFEERTTKYVELALQFANEEIIEVCVELKDLEKKNWSEECERCILNFRNRNARLYIANYIRNQIAIAPHENLYGLERTGIRKIGDTTIFCVGDNIISKVSDNRISSQLWLDNLPFQLDVDMNISLEESFQGVKELVDLVPETGVVLLSHTIGGIMREAFRDARFNPCTILEVVGESGMFKSTYVPQIVQLYNRKSGIKAATRFNSTHRFMEELVASYSDCTIVVDDLHTAQSTQIKRKNELAAEEIIRRISDNTGQGHREGSSLIQRDFRANVVFTGEYDIGQESTASRLLVIRMNKRPDGKILDKYQREQPLLVSTFYLYFIQWYVECYEEIVSEINRRLKRFREEDADFQIHGRLRDSKFYLQTSYMFYLQFCRYSGLLTEENVVGLYKNFDSMLKKLIHEQQGRIMVEDDKKNNIDFLKFISKLYKSKKIALAKDPESFNPKKHKGVIYYGCLCIRRKALEEIVKQYFHSVTVDDVIYQLQEKGALKLGKKKRVVKISKLNKEVGSLVFYAIYLHALE